MLPLVVPQVANDASMCTEPVVALHVLGDPGEQQMTEAEAGDKDICRGFGTPSDQSLDRVAGAVRVHALLRFELAHRGSHLLGTVGT
jgi:hypothetical protein